MTIVECAPPENSLLAPFVDAEAHHIDCFETEASQGLTLQAFITAFYTQPLFQAERLVLRLAAGARSTDAQAVELGAGQRDQFAVWTVRGRTETDILLQDASARTMSWLGVCEGKARFGSVVVPVRDRHGRLTLGPVYHSLRRAHMVYSRALLAGAMRRARA